MLSKIRTYIRTLDHEPLATDVLEYALENLDIPNFEEEYTEEALLMEIQDLIKEEEEFQFPLVINARDKVIINRALDAYIRQMKTARREARTAPHKRAFTKDIRELRDLQEKVVQKL